MNCCFDLTLICRTYQGECSSNSREFEGGISHSRAGVLLDTLGNVVKPIRAVHKIQGPFEGWVKLADAV
jgi:hypothetical protein